MEMIYSIVKDAHGVVIGAHASNEVDPVGVEVSAEIYAAVIASGVGLCTFDGTSVGPYTPTAVVQVPSEVTNYQARAVLIERGFFVKVDTAIRNADQTVQANQIALAAWDYANVFERLSPLISSMASTLKLTSADVDALFIAAAAVV